MGGSDWGLETLLQAFRLVTDVLEMAIRERGEVGGCQCSHY